MKYEAKYASDPGHPDYDQYMSLKGMVDRMHGENGVDISSGDISHRATSAMLRAIKKDAIDERSRLEPGEINGVVLSRGNGQAQTGEYAIAYQGDPANPTVRTLGVPTQQLLAPAEQNLQEINRINEQTQRTQAQERQQTQARQQDQDAQAPATAPRSMF
ncbi:MAG TPA: XVIPCD domain-containing protein [Xanthomonadaceae bacterium]